MQPAPIRSAIERAARRFAIRSALFLTVLASPAWADTTAKAAAPAAAAAAKTAGVARAAVPAATAPRYAVIAWNDLGMHCVGGKDYSIFSILPPFNNLHAQLVNATTGKKVTTGVTLNYEAVADPSGSINTTRVGKTNFWSWARPLYGSSPAADVGLSGNYTPSRATRPMKLDPVNGWFEATGLPITPYDDAGSKNFYPTVKRNCRWAPLPTAAPATCATPNR